MKNNSIKIKVGDHVCLLSLPAETLLDEKWFYVWKVEDNKLFLLSTDQGDEETYNANISDVNTVMDKRLWLNYLEMRFQEKEADYDSVPHSFVTTDEGEDIMLIKGDEIRWTPSNGYLHQEGLYKVVGFTMLGAIKISWEEGEDAKMVGDTQFDDTLESFYEEVDPVDVTFAKKN